MFLACKAPAAPNIRICELWGISGLPRGNIDLCEAGYKLQISKRAAIQRVRFFRLRSSRVYYLNNGAETAYRSRVSHAFLLGTNATA